MMVCLILTHNVIRIYHVLLTSAFTLWPTCTRGFGIREKIRCGLRFFGVYLCGFAVFGPPLHPPLFSNKDDKLQVPSHNPCIYKFCGTFKNPCTVPKE